MAALVTVAMAMQVVFVQRAEHVPPDVLRTVGLDFGAALVVLLGLFVTLIAVAFAAVVATTAVFPRWTMWLAVPAIVLNVVASLGGVFLEDGPLSMEGHLTVFLPAISTVSWYVGVSIAMMRGEAAEPAAT